MKAHQSPPDYHVEVEHAYYSVPYQHIGERMEVRLSARMIEIFAKRQLVASHVRSYKRGARVTLDAHRPANHLAIVDTTTELLMQRAEAIAPSVAQVLRERFHRKRHPEEALRIAPGILRLAQTLVRRGSPNHWPTSAEYTCWDRPTRPGMTSGPGHS